MEHQDTAIVLFNVIIVLISTNILFKYYNLSNKSFWSLFARVLPLVWFIVVVLSGVEDFYFKRTSSLFEFVGFVGLMARNLPILIIFGIIPFVYKFNKLKRAS
jgi:tryptophan-rich sensory protein